MELVLVISAFVISFILTNIIIPPIVKVAHAKKLFDPIEGRKIHTEIVPPLGGIAIFASFVLSAIIATDGLSFDALKYIVAAVTILFFIGLKDDLMDISAKEKFFVQVLAAFILVALGNLRFTSFYGLFGIYEINYSISVIVSVLMAVGLINAYNLIDGIDGLASGLAIMATTVFGVLFYLQAQPQYAVLSFSLAGSLSGFFLFNVFGNKNKIFMGDTGSLIIGIIITALLIRFCEMTISGQSIAFKITPIIPLSLIVVPLVDMVRVMSIRIIRKRSPFSADNNHIHHRLLVLFPKHLTVTLIIIGTNILMIMVAFMLNATKININIQFLMIGFLGIFLSYIPTFLIKSDKNRATQYHRFKLGNSLN